MSPAAPSGQDVEPLGRANWPDAAMRFMECVALVACIWAMAWCHVHKEGVTVVDNRGPNAAPIRIVGQP